ncbi:MAG: hypothetical protein KatS3mg084_0284 [Candidatus Dojkabacteria bacterium]|nr:MAG: hypothetical protein KatS3mg084_0284 [Candidatus Dojkabacteria bacterium]
MLTAEDQNTSKENQEDKSTNTSHLNVNGDYGLPQKMQFLGNCLTVVFLLSVLCPVGLMYGRDITLVSLDIIMRVFDSYFSEIHPGVFSNNYDHEMSSNGTSDSPGGGGYFLSPSYSFYYANSLFYLRGVPDSDRFNVYYDSGSSKFEYRLGSELVMDRSYGFYDLTLNGNDSCRPRLPAYPVTSTDGTRLYFVDIEDPNKVKMMDTNKNVSVIYTTPEPENFIASIAINKNNDLAYTIFEKRPVLFCQSDGGVTGYHLINGNMYKINNGERFVAASDEVIIDFGDNYFIAAAEFSPVGPILYRINEANVEHVMTFGPVVYRGSNYIILYGQYFLSGVAKSVLKVNLDDGSIETLLGPDTVGKEILIFDFIDFGPVVYSDGRIEFKYTDKISIDDVEDSEDPSRLDEARNTASTFVYDIDR